jgi:hypothetical protein
MNMDRAAGGCCLHGLGMYGRGTGLFVGSRSAPSITDRAAWDMGVLGGAQGWDIAIRP